MLIMFFAMMLLHSITPFWWWIIVVPFVYNLIVPLSAMRSFLYAFISAAVLWGAMVLYMSYSFGSLILARMQAVLQIGDSGLLIAATILLAGICAGFAGALGQSVVALFRKTEQDDQLVQENQNVSKMPEGV